MRCSACRAEAPLLFAHDESTWVDGWRYNNEANRWFHRCPVEDQKPDQPDPKPVSPLPWEHNGEGVLSTESDIAAFHERAMKYAMGICRHPGDGMPPVAVFEEPEDAEAVLHCMTEHADLRARLVAAEDDIERLWDMWREGGDARKRIVKQLGRKMRGLAKAVEHMRRMRTANLVLRRTADGLADKLNAAEKRTAEAEAHSERLRGILAKVPKRVRAIHLSLTPAYSRSRFDLAIAEFIEEELALASTNVGPCTVREGCRPDCSKAGHQVSCLNSGEVPCPNGCNHRLDCGGPCVLDQGHDPPHLCGGDTDGPGSCPA